VSRSILWVFKLHSAYCNHIRACRNHTRECHNHTHTCQNHTLRVEITLVRVEITVVSVVITFVRVKITIRVEITLCVYKSHSFMSRYHTRGCHIHIIRVSKFLSCEWKPHSVCIIKLCVCKSYSACRN
jgi:hypothetical protein